MSKEGYDGCVYQDLEAAQARIRELEALIADAVRKAEAHQFLRRYQERLHALDAAGSAMSAELEELRGREEMVLPLVFKWTREAHHSAHCHEGDDYHLGYGAALRVAARDLDHALGRDVITGESREGEDG